MPEDQKSQAEGQKSPNPEILPKGKRQSSQRPSTERFPEDFFPDAVNAVRASSFREINTPSEEFMAVMDRVEDVVERAIESDRRPGRGLAMARYTRSCARIC